MWELVVWGLCSLGLAVAWLWWFERTLPPAPKEDERPLTPEEQDWHDRQW